MSIRTRIADFVVKALDPKRAPIGTQMSWGSGMTAGDYTSTYATSGWVYAAVSKIAQAVGEAEPRMFTRNSNGDVEEVYSHPLLDVLSYCTPFHTRQEAFELEESYLDICGEWAMLIFRDGFGVKELWPINPRQLSVVPHPTNFMSGYVFTAADGMTKIPLETKDVLFIKTPNLQSQYRGQGIVQSIITDIEGDRYAAQWNRNFFINGASHGGAIEIPGTISDEAFERLKAQWAQGHQGVANAHRVAILQGGAKWVDPRIALKDMDFPNLRMMSRDIVLGAFGMSPHMLGAEADVNRASATSAEYVFARWVVLPRLRRIAGKINEFLLPQFPKSENMWLEFDDPTPENNDFDLQMAREGFAAGFLTRNEARELVGMDNLGEPGDIFFMGVMAVPQAMSETPLLASPEATVDTEPSEDGETVTAPDATQDTAENIAAGEKLNGIQIQAAMDVIRNLIAGQIPAEVALELLVAVGIDRERAQNMVADSVRFQPEPIEEPPKEPPKEPPAIDEPDKGKSVNLRDVQWDAFNKRLSPMENKFSGWVKGQFATQRKETLANYHRLNGKSVKIMGDLYKAAEYAKALEKGSNPYLRAMILLSGEAAAADLGSVFSVTNPLVLEFLGMRTAAFGKQITGTIANDIANALKEAQRLGESIDRTADRLQHVFDMADARAELIARTEMVGSANQGSLEAYRQSGVVKEKEWIATRDDRTRETHWEMDGVTVALDDDFRLSDGASGPAPGQTGDPAHDCNCRCALAPVVK